MDKNSRELVMGKLYFKNKDYKMAEKSLVEFLNSNPEDIQALKMLAQVYENLRNFDKAFEHYEKCYLAGPERKGVLLDICRLLLMKDSSLHDVNQDKWLKLAIQAFPSNPIVINLRDSLPSANFLNSTKDLVDDDIYARLRQIERKLDALVSLNGKFEILAEKLDTVDEKLRGLSNIGQKLDTLCLLEPKFDSLEDKLKKFTISERSAPPVARGETKPAPSLTTVVASPPTHAPVFTPIPSLASTTTPAPASTATPTPSPAKSESISNATPAFTLANLSASTSTSALMPTQTNPKPALFTASPSLFAPTQARPNSSSTTSTFATISTTASSFAPISTTSSSFAPISTSSSSFAPISTTSSSFAPISTTSSTFSTLSMPAPSFASLASASSSADPNKPLFGWTNNSTSLFSSFNNSGKVFGELDKSDQDKPANASTQEGSSLFGGGLRTFGDLSNNANQSSEQAGDNENDDGPAEPEELPIEQFCEMEPIEVQTGEEDDDVLFEQRCKLHRFRDKDYKERGVGNIKVLKNRTTGKGRLIMRREQIGLVCLNLWECRSTERVRDSQIRFAGLDASEGDPNTSVFLARFKTKELTDEFLTQLKEIFPEAEHK